MDIKRMKYNQELIKNKIRLEKELKMVEQEITAQQAKCDHIKVSLGWDGSFEYRDTSISMCLLCREYDPDTKYKVVVATNYKREQYSHGQLERYREERLRDLQELTITMIAENPEITEEELIEKLDKIIIEDEAKTKNIEKKLGYKFI